MREQIEIIWNWKDIQRQDETLTKEQCCEVLEWLDKNHDDNIGINWGEIYYAIQQINGEQDEIHKSRR